VDYAKIQYFHTLQQAQRRILHMKWFVYDGS